MAHKYLHNCNVQYIVVCDSEPGASCLSLFCDCMCLIFKIVFYRWCKFPLLTDVFVPLSRTSDRLEIIPLSNSLLFSPQKTFYDVSNSKSLCTMGISVAGYPIIPLYVWNLQVHYILYVHEYIMCTVRPHLSTPQISSSLTFCSSFN